MVALVNHRVEGKLRVPDSLVLLSLASLMVMLVSLALPAEGFPGIDTCAFHALTGLSCPGCGLTRAFCAISHGHFQAAWNLHPFSFLLYAAMLVGAAAPLLNGRFDTLKGRRITMALRIVFLSMAIAMLIYGGWRAVGEFAASRASSDARTLPVVDRVQD